MNYATLNVQNTKRYLVMERCPECGKREPVMDSDQGEVICSGCGLVLEDVMMDQRPEWRAYTHEEKEARSRVGSPITLLQYDKGLSTTFKPHENASGGRLSSKTRFKMRRLRQWNIRLRIRSSIARNLSQAMMELNNLADKLHIPKAVREEAALIYRKSLNNGLVRGRSIAAIAAASLYAACRISGTPRSLDEMVEASSRKRGEIARCYRLVHRELDLKMPIDGPEKYVSKIASKVGLSQKVQNTAIDILKKAREMRGIVGKGPAGIAAAALYIASMQEGDRVTQKKLAQASGVTEVTVRNRYKGLSENLGI